MPDYLIYIVICFQMVLTVLTISHFVFYIIEKRKISNLTHKLIKKNNIETEQDIISIKKYLLETIHCDVNEKPRHRSLLRATAMQTLKSGHGFCGDNARLAINILHVGGIKANRIYLFGKKWIHIVVEMKLKGQWFLFDGHNDPEMLLTDEMVCKIPSEEIDSYPNNYPMNPWLNFCRIKLLRRKPFPKSWCKIRLASFLILFFENPNLIKAVFFLLLFLLSFIVYLF